MKSKEIYPELEDIKHEIQSLKVLVLEAHQTPKQVVSFQGLLKGSL